MDRIIPDIDWCREISIKLGVPTRCPFSTADECPRYYQSLSLLSGAGHTSIAPEKDEILQKKWETSDLWPMIEEQATSISGSPDRKKSFSNYCPEIAYDRFNLFASELYPYHDEIDHDNGIKFGAQERMPDGHWVFDWSHVSKMHYTDCPIYSPLKLKRESEKNNITLLEKTTKRIKDNPLIVILIILSIAVVGIGSFTDALSKIKNGIVTIFQKPQISFISENLPKRNAPAGTKVLYWERAKVTFLVPRNGWTVDDKLKNEAGDIYLRSNKNLSAIINLHHMAFYSDRVTEWKKFVTLELNRLKEQVGQFGNVNSRDQFVDSKKGIEFTFNLSGEKGRLKSAISTMVPMNDEWYLELNYSEDTNDPFPEGKQTYINLVNSFRFY